MVRFRVYLSGSGIAGMSWLSGDYKNQVEITSYGSAQYPEKLCSKPVLNLALYYCLQTNQCHDMRIESKPSCKVVEY